MKKLYAILGMVLLLSGCVSYPEYVKAVAELEVTRYESAARLQIIQDQEEAYVELKQSYSEAYETAMYYRSILEALESGGS